MQKSRAAYADLLGMSVCLTATATEFVCLFVNVLRACVGFSFACVLLIKQYYDININSTQPPEYLQKVNNP